MSCSNTVTAHDGDIYHICAISVTGSLIIKGDGTLKATSGVVLDNSSYYTIAISATEDITIESGTITAIGSDAYAGSSGISSDHGNIYIKGGTVYANCAYEDGNVVDKSGETASGFSVGIYCSTTSGDIVISGGTVYAYGGTSYSENNYGIAATDNLKISGGTIYGYGGESSCKSSYGVAATGNVSISGGEVNAESSTAYIDSCGLGASGTLSITGGKVKATGGDANRCSYGVASDQDIIIGEARVDAKSGTSPYSLGVGANGSLTISYGTNLSATGSGQSIGAASGYIFGDNMKLLAGTSAADSKILESVPTEFSAYPYIRIASEYAATVKNGSGDGIYIEGDIVNIVADTAEEGKQFKEWTVVSGDVSFADALSATTTFTMSDGPVEIAATYEDIPGYIPDVEQPSITSQPSNVTVKEGATASFSVTATGDSLAYQWKVDKNDGKGWVDIDGATKAEYSVKADKSFEGFKYKCVVSNSEGSVESTSATLHVNVDKTTSSSSVDAGDNANMGWLYAAIIVSGAIIVAANKKSWSLKKNVSR